MPKSTVTIEWEEGLHMRAAARVVRCAQKFQSDITIRLCGHVANAKNILSIIALCAVMGATLEIEATGDDAHDALKAVETVFATSGPPDGPLLKKA